MNNFETELIYNIIFQYIKQNRIGDIVLDEINNYFIKNKIIPEKHKIKEITKEVLLRHGIKLEIEIKKFNIKFWIKKNGSTKKISHIFAISKQALLEITENCELL